MPQMPNRHVCHCVPKRWPSSGQTDGHMAKSLPVIMAFGSITPLESTVTKLQHNWHFTSYIFQGFHYIFSKTATVFQKCSTLGQEMLLITQKILRRGHRGT